jgi:hypothetical protein
MSYTEVYTDNTGQLSLTDTNNITLSNIIDELNIQTNQANAISQSPSVAAYGVLTFDGTKATDMGAGTYLRYVSTQSVTHNLGYVPLCFATHDYGPDQADTRGNYVPYYQNEYPGTGGFNAATLLSLTIILTPSTEDITVTISSRNRDTVVGSNFHYVYYYITNTPEFIS